MNDAEYNLLRRICSGEINNLDQLSEFDTQRVEQFEDRGLVHTWISGDIEPFVAADDALNEHLRLKEEQAAQKTDEKSAHKRDYRHDWRIAVLGALLAGVMLVVAEKLLDLVPWKALFQQLSAPWAK